MAREPGDYQVRRDRSEIVRERHRPDWLPITFGVVSALACAGVLALIGEGFRLLKFTPNTSVPFLIVKLLWLMFTVSASTYLGGYVTGFTTSVANTTSAALNGLLVTVITILAYFLMAWIGESPIPGMILSRTDSLEAEEGLLYWAMMLALPNLFAAIFGAMHGNLSARRHRSFLGPNIVLPLEETNVHPLEKREQPPRAA